MDLFLCGDVMIGRGIDQVLPHPCDPTIHEPWVKDARTYVKLAEEAHGTVKSPVTLDYVWGDALAELERVNPAARIINLETSVTCHDEPWPDKGINYRASPANAACLASAEIDACTLANNHVLDWGRTGLSETLATLDELGIAHTGAGGDRETAASPAVVDAGDGHRVLVFGLGHVSSGIPAEWEGRADRSGVALLTRLDSAAVARVDEAVNRHRKPGDVVVVSIHWGHNWAWDVPRDHVRFAHGLIDSAGVHLVHGHSSHHVKGIEVYRGHLVLYGCGDLLTDYEGIDGYDAFRGDLGLMYLPRIDPADGTLQRLEMVPTTVRRLRIERAEPQDARWLREVLVREGRRFGTGADLDEDGRLVLRY